MSEPVQPRETQFVSNEALAGNGRALASNPGEVTLDPRRLRRLSPSLFGVGALLPARAVARKTLATHLLIGDSRAAVVLGVEPLLVAAYSDDFDAVVLLRFDQGAVDTRVDVGSRLLTVNTYFRGAAPARDIVQGPHGSPRWANFHPVIADFVTADLSRVERRKAAIGEPEWQRTWHLGQQHLAARPDQIRDGAPHRSGRPS